MCEETFTVLWPPCGRRHKKETSLQISALLCHLVLCFIVMPPHDMPIPKSLVGLFWQLLEADADSSLQRKKRQSQDFLQPYIAAKLDALPEIFTLGDEKKYNGYHNKPLPGQQQYRCFVLADLTDHESVSDLYVFVRIWACTAPFIDFKASVIEPRCWALIPSLHVLKESHPSPLMVYSHVQYLVQGMVHFWPITRLFGQLLCNH